MSQPTPIKAKWTAKHDKIAEKYIKDLAEGKIKIKLLFHIKG